MNNKVNSIEVEVDTLDNFAQSRGINNIDVLKIDTEGADTWVLYGAKRLLEEKKIKHIFFESNPSRMKMLNIGKNEALEFLTGVGYTVEEDNPENFYAYPK